MTFSNTLIKASAGSGKTFQLSNRYLQLILCGAAPESILATTFTRKAAGEILDRILQRLADAASDDGERRKLSQFVLIGDRHGGELSHEEVLATLAKLVRNIHRLRVSTLDSFFQQIAGNLSLELGMPADWNIMEEDDRSPLLLEGIRELLSQLGKDKSVELMHLLFKGETRSSVTREINTLLKELAAVYDESTPDAWRQLQHREKQLPVDEIERLVVALEKAEIAQTQKGESNKTMLNARNKDLNTIRDAIATGREIPWIEIGAKGMCLKVVDGTYTFSRAEMPQSLRDVYDDIVYQVCATVVHRLASQTEAMGELLDELTSVVDKLKNRYRLFDFSDITNRLSQASLDAQFRQIAHRINANTHHLLLDEFQDTSPNQWRVLRPFAQRIVGARGEGQGTRDEFREQSSGSKVQSEEHKLLCSLRSDLCSSHPSPLIPHPSFFCVGDVKQAIYGWRGGVAAIFDAIENDLGSLKEEYLDTSYRSCQAVIDTVNKVFSTIGSNAALNANAYDRATLEAADHWAKRFEHHQTARVKLTGCCSLRTSLLQPTQFDANGEPIKPSLEDRNLAHLRYVIDAIVTRHRQSPKKTIGVLTRTNKMVQRIIFGLRSEGIEASEEGGNPLDQSPAVELILSALSLADYPGNRVACYHLAHSPLGCATSATNPLLGITPENYRDEVTMQSISHRIRERLMLEGYPTVLHEWVTQIAPVCDQRDLGRMIQLLELAAAYQRKAKIRTTPFINLVRAKHVESPTPSPIKVMSIHKSKGLQFDIVVLPEFEAKLAGSKTPRVVAGREESPTSPVSAVLAYPAKDIRPFLPERFQKIAELNETERIEESLCVLYVAMTRAVHELLMILMPEEGAREEGRGASGNQSPKPTTLPKTLAGVLQAGLDVKEPMVVSGIADRSTGAILYQHGDRNWAAESAERETQSTKIKESSDLPKVEQYFTIQLATKSKKSSKNLTRKTPSGQEGTRGEGRGMWDEERESHFPPHASRLSSLAPRPSPLTWGTAMHACFEQIIWLERGLPERDKLLEVVTPIMQDANAAAQVINAFYASCEQPEVLDALSLKTYERQWVRDKNPASSLTPRPSPLATSSALRWEVYNERRFWATPEPDVLLQGSIDRLVLLYDDSGPKLRVIQADVIDFKSNHIENDETLAALTEHYAPQLEEYRKAVTAMYGLTDDQITTRLLFTEPGKIVTV